MANIGAIRLGEGEEYALRSEVTPTYNLDDAREARIVDWRVTCFEGLGFSPARAGALAMRRDVDRIEVERMAAAGASDEQVCLILL